MKKKNYAPPTMEDLRADEMHLLAGSKEQNTGTGYDYEEGEGDPDPGRP